MTSDCALPEGTPLQVLPPNSDASRATSTPGSPDRKSTAKSCNGDSSSSGSTIPSEVVYHLPRDASIQTRHLIVYNTGPAVGVEEPTLRRVFEAYGTVERVMCLNPAAARVLVTFHEVSSAVRAKDERNRPPGVEERVRKGVAGAALASDVFAPKPGEPCPLLGRWLKVAFADVRTRHKPGAKGGASAKDSAPPALPGHLADFKAFDALAASGAASCDSRPTPCPLCGRSCGGQRGLRMHLVGAHPLEIRDRDHMVLLLKQGSASLPPPPQPSNGGMSSIMDADEAGDESGGAPSSAVGAGAAAKGRAAAALPPGFAAARAGDVEGLRRLVDSGSKWDPRTATDKNGSSLLDWAAGEGKVEVCRYLLEECGVDAGRGCPIRGRAEGRTSLHWAARGGHEEVCRLLLATPRPLDSGVDSDKSEAKDGFSVRQVSPDAPAAEGTTPLHWACWGAHLSTCRLLFSRGADHRRVNAYGCTVAHWCGLSGDVGVCRWLSGSVEEGGAGGLDWAKTNLQGHTICHKAALKGHRGLLEWLRLQTEQGVVPECAWARDEGGYTPQDIARLAGHVDLADWLGKDGTVPSAS